MVPGKPTSRKWLLLLGALATILLRHRPSLLVEASASRHLARRVAFRLPLAHLRHQARPRRARRNFRRHRTPLLARQEAFRRPAVHPLAVFRRREARSLARQEANQQPDRIFRRPAFREPQTLCRQVARPRLSFRRPLKGRIFRRQVAHRRQAVFRRREGHRLARREARRPEGFHRRAVRVPRRMVDPEARRQVVPAIHQDKAFHQEVHRQPRSVEGAGSCCW